MPTPFLRFFIFESEHSRIFEDLGKEIFFERNTMREDFWRPDVTRFNWQYLNQT